MEKSFYYKPLYGLLKKKMSLYTNVIYSVTGDRFSCRLIPDVHKSITVTNRFVTET